MNETAETMDTLRARLAAAEAREGALRESLNGMLESYYLLLGQATSHFQNPVLKGIIEGAFLTEPAKARAALAAPSGGAALAELLAQERAAALEEMRERCAKAVENCFPCAPTHAQDEAIWYAVKAIRALPAAPAEAANK